MTSRAHSLYLSMLKIRLVEETIAELYQEQEMRCPVHLCSGQEAVAAGVCANLRQDDYALSNHRSHGHYLSKGGSLKCMMAEIYGKETGTSRGKGGSQHLTDSEVGFLGATPIVGGIIPVAVGVAFGTLMKKEKKITVVFLGDAASEEGVFAESLNFAALKKLPVIFVCENNLYSVYSPLAVRQPAERDNVAIARAYGIFAKKGDGNDVEIVDLIAGEAVDHVRQGLGPAYIEFDTYRFREHCGPNYDNNIGYRDEAEYLTWRKRCPLETYEQFLLQEKKIDQKTIDDYKQKLKVEISEAIKFAKQSPFPPVEEAFLHVYA